MAPPKKRASEPPKVAAKKDGSADLAASSRPIKDSEAASLASLGDLRSQLLYPELERDISEAELLEMLVRNAGRVLTRGQLMDRVWGSNYFGDGKTLDVHIKRLRSKFESDPANPELIQTIRGLGYLMEKNTA